MSHSLPKKMMMLLCYWLISPHSRSRQDSLSIRQLSLRERSQIPTYLPTHTIDPTTHRSCKIPAHSHSHSHLHHSSKYFPIPWSKSQKIKLKKQLKKHPSRWSRHFHHIIYETQSSYPNITLGQRISQQLGRWLVYQRLLIKEKRSKEKASSILKTLSTKPQTIAWAPSRHFIFLLPYLLQLVESPTYQLSISLMHSISCSEKNTLIPLLHLSYCIPTFTSTFSYVSNTQ